MDRTSGKSQSRGFWKVQDVIPLLRPHFRFWLPPVVCYFIILFFSVIGVPGSLQQMTAGLDKVLHFLEFLVLGVLFGQSVLKESHYQRVPIRTKCMVAFSALIMSAMGELLQFLNRERSPELADFFSNAAGFGTGLLYWQGYRYITRLRGRF